MAARTRKPKHEPEVQGVPVQVPGPATTVNPVEPQVSDEVNASILNDEDTNLSAIKAKLEERFSFLGTDFQPDTVVPRPRNRNNGDEASEYITAEILKKAAEDRFKAAQEAAEAAGVFGDRSEYKDGETRMVYQTPHYVISVKVGKSSKAINKEKVEETLSELVAKEKLASTLAKCMKPRAAPVQFISALK